MTNNERSILSAIRTHYHSTTRSNLPSMDRMAKPQIRRQTRVRSWLWSLGQAIRNTTRLCTAPHLHQVRINSNHSTTKVYGMNIERLLQQARYKNGTIDLQHYTNLVLLEACRLVKETPTTSAYTTFDEQVAITQRADCFNSIYNLIVQNLEDASIQRQITWRS